MYQCVCAYVTAQEEKKKPFCLKMRFDPFQQGLGTYSPLEGSLLPAVPLHVTRTSLQGQDDGKHRVFVFRAAECVQVKITHVANSGATMEGKDTAR